MQGCEPYGLGLSFVCIFKQSEKTEATDLAVSQLLGSTFAIISAHVQTEPQHSRQRGPPNLELGRLAERARGSPRPPVPGYWATHHSKLK